MSVREEGPLLKPLTRERVPKSEPTAINSSGSEGSRNETNISQTPTLNPNPLFRNGMPLPKEIKTQLTDTLVHVPLEEIDPFYSKRNTFVVIGNQRIYRFSKNLTLLTLSPFNAFRRSTIYLLTHWFFSAFIVAVVLLNCFFALKNTSTNNALFYISECVFLSIYTTELLVTIVGRGLILVPFSCLRIPWNVFNLFLIVNGWLYLNFSFWTYKIAYSLRIFKIIPYVSGLQLCFEFLLEIIARLRSTIISCGLLSVLFSTIGIHLFKGSLTQQCIPNVHDNHTYDNQQIKDDVDDENGQLGTLFLQDHSGTLCGNYSTSSGCEEGYTCLMGNTNPNYGYTSFDSFPHAFIQTLRLFMQDYPEDLYHKIWSTSGSWHVIYFAGIFLFGTFILKTYVMTIIARAIIEKTNISFVGKEESSSITQPGRCLDLLCGWNCSETFGVVRETIKKFMDHGLTQLFICTIILIDIFSMAYYYYGIEDMNPIMHIIASYYICKVCFAVYIVELILQMVALSPLHYFKSYWNVFDFFIIVLYLVNRVTKKFGMEDNTLDILLVARMFKLGSRWSTLELQIIILMQIVRKYLSYFVLALFSIYSFAVLGVLLYKDELYDDDYVIAYGKPIWNFSTFMSSFMISFRVLCGEWIESLWDCLDVTGKSCFVYFFSAVVILNMFLTLLSISTIFTTYKVLKMQENDIFTSKKSSKATSLHQKLVTILSTVKLKVVKQFSNKTAVAVDGDVPNDTQQSENTQQSTGSSESRQNKCKQLITAIHQNKYIKLLSILVIAVSSIALIPNDIQHGHHPNGIDIILYTIEIVFTVYFLIDIIMALISLGFLKSICSLNWLFDTAIVLEMIFNLSLLDFYTSTFQSYGVISLRCLRPLMLIFRVQRLKAVFSGIARELTFLLRFMVAAAFVWIYLAIQGVRVYGGLFYSCLEWKETEYKAVPYAKHECLAANLSWINSPHNFDDIKSSLLNIALITTRNGWKEILLDALTPHKEYERFVPIEAMTVNIYIVAIFIFGAFFVCNIIFGAAIFHVKHNKENFMTFDQVEEYNKKKLGNSSATVIEKPTLAPFTFIHDLVFSPPFEGLVMAVIIVDVVALAGSSLAASERIISLRDLIFSTVTFLYTVELLLKLIAWKQHFLKNSLNIFDLIIVLFSISAYMIDNGVYAEVVAVIRTLRILRILNFKPFLRRASMISTFLLGLSRIYPVLLNLIFMLTLFMFTFGVLGMSHFKTILTEETLPDMINFERFSHAILTIFQLTTFSGWDAILEAIGNEYDCNPPRCGNFTQSTLFLLTYLFIVFIIVTNMYSVLILELLNCFDDTKESLANSNPNNTSDSPNNIIVETINLNPSCSVSVRRKSVACFVIEDGINRDAQIVILPQETVQVVFRTSPN